MTTSTQKNKILAVRNIIVLVLRTLIVQPLSSCFSFDLVSHRGSQIVNLIGFTFQFPRGRIRMWWWGCLE